MTEEKLKQILESIEKITVFLEEKKADPFIQGILLLQKDHPELHLIEGTIDVFVVTRPHEKEEPGNYSVGWIDNGQIRGIWAQDEKGVIIDPWLDERVRSGFTNAFLEYLPVVIRHPDHGGPRDIVHHEGKRIGENPINEDFYREYMTWREQPDREAAHKRMRVLLGSAGVEPIQEYSVWAQAVFIANHQDKAESNSEESPQEEHKEQEKPRKDTTSDAIERKEVVKKAIEDMNKPQKLSIIKAIISAAAGLGVGYAIIQFL